MSIDECEVKNMTAANIITVIRLGIIPFFIACMLFQGVIPGLIAFILFALAAITDKIDGYVAKKFNQVTDLGKIMDPLADKLLVFAALVVFTAQGLTHPIALFLLLARELSITSIRALLASNGRVMGAGISGKIKTLVQILSILIILALPLLPEFGISAFSKHTVLIANVLSWIMAAVSVISGIEYCLHGFSFKNIKKR